MTKRARRPPALPLRIAVALALLPGCSGCDEAETSAPFSLDAPSDASSASVNAPPTAAPSAPSKQQLEVGEDAPDKDAWVVGKSTFKPPAGAAYVHGLVLDRAQPALLAWTRTTKEYRLVAHAAERDLAKLGGPGADFVRGGCRVEPRIERLAPHLAAATLRTACDERASERAWSAVIQLPGGSEGAERKLDIAWRHPSSGGRITGTYQATDADHDGRDDVSLTLALEGDIPGFDGAPPLSATLAYFDRPAGLARAPGGLRGDMKAHAQRLSGLARRKDAATETAGLGRQLLRFEAVLCDDDGRSLVRVQDATLSCAGSSVAPEVWASLGLSAASSGDALGVARALRHVDVDSASAKKLRAELDKLAPTRSVQNVLFLVARPVRSRPSTLGPFLFEADGDLLIHSLDGLVLYDRSRKDELPVTSAEPWGASLGAWTLASVDVARPAKHVEGDDEAETPPPVLAATPAQAPSLLIRAVERRCGPDRVVARVQRNNETKEVIVPLLTRNARTRWLSDSDNESCEAGELEVTPLAAGPDYVGFGTDLSPILVTWSGEEPEAAAWNLAADPRAGSAGTGASVDASAIAWAEPEQARVWVVHQGAAARWTHDDLDRPTRCAAAPAAAKVACVEDGKTALLVP